VGRGENRVYVYFKSPCHDPVIRNTARLEESKKATDYTGNDQENG
jgi:hypothetical protein